MERPIPVADGAQTHRPSIIEQYDTMRSRGRSHVGTLYGLLLVNGAAVCCTAVIVVAYLPLLSLERVQLPLAIMPLQHAPTSNPKPL